jgi:hypothetical protein
MRYAVRSTGVARPERRILYLKIRAPWGGGLAACAEPTGHLLGCRRRISKARGVSYALGAGRYFPPPQTVRNAKKKLGLGSFISETRSPSRHGYHLFLERSRRAELRVVSIRPQFVLAA